nr:uncharacterized protein LOC109163613 [Ipomoea trifida]GMC56530.1 Transmembrane protein [Ipomoea batatas]
MAVRKERAERDTCPQNLHLATTCPDTPMTIITVQIEIPASLSFDLQTKHLTMESGTGKQERRNAADTHKMSPEEVKRAGVEESKRPPGHNPGTVLHQRRQLPFSLTTIAIAGVAISGAVWYFTLYAKKKPEASAADVAKVAAGGGGPESTHPRK